MNKYVLGFMFDDKYILLIKKNRPEWQKDKLNGIGGHIKEGESSIKAMVREFAEETGVSTHMHEWTYMGRMFRNGSEEFEVDVFRMKVPDVRGFLQKRAISYWKPTDEYTYIVEINAVLGTAFRQISNLKWLILMCVDDNDGFLPYEMVMMLRNPVTVE